MKAKLPFTVGNAKFTLFPYETAYVGTQFLSIDDEELFDTLSKNLIKHVDKIYRNGNFIPVNEKNQACMDNKILFHEEKSDMSVLFLDNVVYIGTGVKLR